MVVPMPLMPNTVSVRTAPPSSVPNWMPTTVTTGMSAFRKPCFMMVIFSPWPLARAVRM